MTSKGLEDLLWNLAGNEGKDGPLSADGRGPADGMPPEEPEPLNDEQLQRYRSGELEEEEVRRLEEALSFSPSGRQRLAELANVRLDAPSEEVRRRVLEAAPGGAARTPMHILTRRWWLSAAATLLVAALLVPSLLNRRLPEELVFDVTAAGRPPARSLAFKSEGIPSLATTRVTIIVEPRGEAHSGLDFGLYRVDGSRLKRLDLDPGVRKETERGTARFSALAQSLVGVAPGDYEVLIAVAREGDLPKELANVSEDDAVRELEAGGRRRVYREIIHLLPSEP